MKATQVILSRGLPKTGETISLVEGRDGYYQAGWWQGLKLADNRERFISKTIGGKDVVIDRATGLMWSADGNDIDAGGSGTRTWVDCIDFANAADFAGFEDWRLPNIVEWLSIVNYAIENPVIPLAIFPNTQLDNYWTSTTHILDTDNAWYLDAREGWGYWMAKTNSMFMKLVRGGV